VVTRAWIVTSAGDGERGWRATSLAACRTLADISINSDGKRFLPMAGFVDQLTEKMVDWAQSQTRPIADHQRKTRSKAGFRDAITDS
jgi:hypothetical protein